MKLLSKIDSKIKMELITIIYISNLKNKALKYLVLHKTFNVFSFLMIEEIYELCYKADIAIIFLSKVTLMMKNVEFENKPFSEQLKSTKNTISKCSTERHQPTYRF